MEHREGEASFFCFRAERYFRISGLWYFSTREYLQVGPFNCRDDAEIELMFYLRHVGEWGNYTAQYQADFNAVHQQLI